MDAISIPIFWLLDDGTPTNDIVNGWPCVSILFTQNRPGPDGFDAAEVKPVIAMIDTGCNHNVIDESFFVNAPIMKRVQSSSFDNSGIVTVREGSLIFTGSTVSGSQNRLTIFEEIASYSFSKTPYQAILGRRVLKLGKLNYDGRVGSASLTITQA